MERVLRRQAAAVRRDAAAGGGQRRRSSTGGGSPRSCDGQSELLDVRLRRRCRACGRTALELGPRGARFTAGGIELETRLRGRFNVENVLGAVAAARLLGIPDDAIAYGVQRAARRARPLRGGRRGPAVRRARRLRAHARLARERAAHGARPGRRPRHLRLRLRRRPRSRQAPADGRDRVRARGRRDRHLRQPAQRGSRGDHRRDRRLERPRRSRSSPTGARRSRGRRARARRATSS